MAGQLCSGHKIKNAKVKNSKAYCEGRAGAKAGMGTSDNPHAEGSDANEAWDDGIQSWLTNPDEGSRDCCADEFGGGYEPQP